ncbi:MAG: hypothetical protein ACM3O7_06975 [Acidobacteriota bacterium]
MTRIGRRWPGFCLLAAGAGLVLAGPVAGAQQPWVISGPVTVTQPVEVGDVLVVSGGSLTVTGVPEPGFRLAGNLAVVGDGRATFADSVVEIESTYHGQYSLAAVDQGTLAISRCQLVVPRAVQYALVSSGSAHVVVEDSDFGSAQLVATGTGTLEASRLNGHFEVILQESSTILLHDIPRDPGTGDLWVWPTFGPGSRAVYSPPLPGWVASWSFPPAGATGLGERCEIERCQVKLWPLLVGAGSDLTLRDIAPENWVVVGLHLPHDAAFTGLVNGQRVEERELGLADRTLRLERAAVDSWNLYPESAARVVVRDSRIGELLAFDDSRVWLERTVVDGSGGFFGARGGSQVHVEGGSFTCDVQASDDATLVVSRSQLLPYPHDATGALTRFGAFDRGRLLLVQTPTSTTATAGGSGLVAFAALADPPLFPPAGAAALSGTLASFSLDPRLLPQQWRLQAFCRGEPGGTLIADGDDNLVDAPIGVWSGADPGTACELRATITDASGRALTATWPVDRIRIPRRRLERSH